MTQPTRSNLPALAERSIGESEYRALLRRAERADALELRVQELERALAIAASASGPAGDANGDLVAALLPVLDSFSAAIDSARAEQSHSAIVDGVGLAEREMHRVLSRFGLERISADAGIDFDLCLHETLEGLDALVAREPRIAAELRPGYRRGGRVLRRAIVRIETRD